MRVLLVSEVFWPYGSGGELATYLWTRLLSQCIGMTLVTARISSDVESELASLGVDVVKLRLDLSSRARLWSSLSRVANVLADLVKEHDIVWIPRLSYPLIPLAKELGAAVVVHLHDYVCIDPSGAVVSPRYGVGLREALGLRSYLLRLLSKPLWRKNASLIERADARLFVSSSQRRIVCEVRPRLCERSYVVPNPLPRMGGVVEPSDDVHRVLEILKNRSYVLFGGGLSRLKGYDIVRAVARVLKRFNIVVLVSKAGSLRYDSESNILYMPRLRYGDYMYLLRNATAFLYPSIYEEPLPYAVIEAVLLRKPLIVTRVGGVPEILGDDYPLYLTSLKPEHIESVVEALVKQYDRVLEHVAQRARALETSWSDDVLRERLLGILRELLA